jgi:glycosyltransferase involved in cell wall biosynthesis
LEEGLSLATIEGLACGVPVVASEVGGMAVRLRGHALLTPRRDVDAMAEVFFQISRDPDKARAQAEQGRVWIEAECRRDVAFEDWRRVFAEVAAGGARSGPR